MSATSKLDGPPPGALMLIHTGASNSVPPSCERCGCGECGMPFASWSLHGEALCTLCANIAALNEVKSA